MDGKSNETAKQDAAQTKIPERVTLSTQIIQGVLNYLQTRPFNEVATLINSIMSDHKPVE